MTSLFKHLCYMHIEKNMYNTYMYMYPTMIRLYTVPVMMSTRALHTAAMVMNNHLVSAHKEVLLSLKMMALQ